MTSCNEVGEEAAVALLTGGPSPDWVTEHLRTCPACAVEWRALGQVTGLLAATRDTALAPEVRPDPDLLRRLLGEASRTRRREFTLVGAAAAAALLVVALPLGIWLGGQDGTTAASGSLPSASSATSGPHASTGVATPAPTASGSPSGQSTSGQQVLAEGSATLPGIHAYVEVRPTSWGSDVAVSTEGLTPGTVCNIIVVDRNGRRERAGSWTVSTDYRTGTPIHGTVHTSAEEISQVDLVDESSRTPVIVVPIT